MAKTEDDEDIYDEDKREDMEDEISPEEEGFMKGYDDADEEAEEKKDKDEEDKDEEDEDDKEEE
jgi:hypothetical protein